MNGVNGYLERINSSNIIPCFTVPDNNFSRSTDLAKVKAFKTFLWVQLPQHLKKTINKLEIEVNKM